MRHPVAVAVRDRGEQLRHDVDGAREWGDGGGGYAVEEGEGVAEVEDQGEGVVVVEGVVDVEDVGVSGEEGHEFGFVEEALAVGGVGEEGLVDDLAGVGVAGDGVVAAVDCAEAATADFLAHLVLGTQG